MLKGRALDLNPVQEEAMFINFTNLKKVIAVAVMLACVIALSPGVSISASKGRVAHEINRGHLPKLLYRAVKLSDSKISEVKPESYEWEWTGAVLMIGLSEMYELTGERRYLDYIKRWIDHHLEKGYTLSKSDQIVPGLLLLRLYKATGEKRYLDHAKRIGRYITDKALRTKEGGLLHFGAIGGKSMWIDSLFMFGPFLIELAKATGDKRYIDEAIKQYLIMYSHLQSSSGLCKHYWDETSDKTNDAYWLRGNAWALAASAIVLSSLPKDYNPESRARLLDHYKKHVRGITKHQDKNGLWHTVIDKRKTYIESSGTALVAFALIRGVTSGLIEDKYMTAARRALFGLMDCVRVHPDGFCTISDVSLGTRPGNVAYYNQVTLAENVPYGVGAYAMAVKAYCDREGYKYDPAIMHVEDGWEALRWGRIEEAKKATAEALEYKPRSSSVHFLAGFIVMADTVVKLIEAVTDMSVGAKGMTPEKFQRRMVEEFAPSFAFAGKFFALVEEEKNFTQVTERLIFLGGSSFGYIQWDLAEVYLLDTFVHFAEAAFYFIGSYDIDGPPLLLARRKFGKIVQDPKYPNFLKLNDSSAELLPKSRQAMAGGFSKIKAMVGHLRNRPENYPGNLITIDTLRLRGNFVIPGIVESQPMTKMITKSWLAGVVLRRIARNVPEKLPGWMDNARKSVLDGKVLHPTKSVNLNLAALFDKPQNLRDLFSKRGPDGSKTYPDPTLGGLLPGMTNKGLNKITKLF